MGKHVLVIGAGIAGLSAASYLQRNGFQTEIFESNSRPGGLCTSWRRDGYNFDGCIHWLMGSSPSSNLNWIWKELGAGDLDYVEWKTYASILLSDGDLFTVHTDPDQFEGEMLRLGPEDGTLIKKIADGVRAMRDFDLPAAFDRLSLAEGMSLLSRLPRALPILTKWMKKPLSTLVDGMKSDRLREGFGILFGDSLRELPAGAFFVMLGFMAKGSSGYPIGGSDAFARAIERKYLELGGRIRYGFRVDQIVVENGTAVGLRGNGAEVRGDIVISAADAYDTVHRMLGGWYVSRDLQRAFESGKRYPSLIYVSLGLAKDCSALPHSQVFRLEKPLVLENGALTKDTLGVRFFSFDPTSAPEGKTAAAVMIETTNDAFWTELKRRDPEAYEAEKESTAKRVIEALDSRFPGLGAAVETFDVATPNTFIRYTNNWHGSYEGWLPSVGTLGKSMAKTFPGLSNFYQLGQWVNPGGGLPPCGIDGRNLAKRLCRREGLAFDPDGTGEADARPEIEPADAGRRLAG
jgi:phytoene dehydrogenase-like protein